MQAITCTLALASDPSQKANVNIVWNDDNTRTWKRWGADVGGLHLYDDHGVWDYHPENGSLTLWFTKRHPGGITSGIGLQEVPSNVFREVTCGRSVSGPAFDSGKDQQLRYTLWFGCV
jgi:hypothetical protein